MIIATWKPKYKNIDGKSVNIYYEKQDLKDIDNFTTNIKIVYRCDTCNNISSTVIHSLRRAKWNNLKHQMCRKCRTIKLEKEVKKCTITYEKIKKEVEKIGYKILSTKENFEKQPYPSQAKLKVSCKRNHIYNISWVNFSKGKRCRKCYEEEKYENAVKYKEGYNLYKYLVTNNTENNYNKYKDIINPEDYKRGHDKHHLDHKFSIYEGFKRKIDPKIIGSVVNLTMMTYRKNIQKSKKCSITENQLFKEYEEWENLNII